MSNESSNKMSIHPSEEVTALLRNCRDLVLHQMISDARAVLRATKRIAAEFSVGNGDLFDSLDTSISSKPYYAAMADIEKAMVKLKAPPSKKQKPKFPR